VHLCRNINTTDIKFLFHEEREGEEAEEEKKKSTKIKIEKEMKGRSKRFEVCIYAET